MCLFFHQPHPQGFSLKIWSWFWAALKVDRAILSYLVSYYYTVRSNDVKVLKSRWNSVKTNTTTRGNNIYTLLITFIAFSSFILSKFQTLYSRYILSYYAWATCGSTENNLRSDWIEKLRLLTIIKINITRWNMYWDNNFHSQRYVLRVMCPWKPRVG